LQIPANHHHRRSIKIQNIQSNSGTKVTNHHRPASQANAGASTTESAKSQTLLLEAQDR